MKNAPIRNGQRAGAMVSTTNYAGARAATLNAARDLYGLNSTEYKAVAAAWTAVAVN